MNPFVCTFSHEPGATLLDCLLLVRLAASKREARQLIESGAISLNFIVQKDPTHPIRATNFLHGAHLIFCRGKTKWGMISLVSPITLPSSSMQ